MNIDFTNYHAYILNDCALVPIANLKLKYSVLFNPNRAEWGGGGIMAPLIFCDIIPLHVKNLTLPFVDFLLSSLATFETQIFQKWPP